MGGGYSDKFVGTAGAIGDNHMDQLSFSDTLPVRSKPRKTDVGASGGGLATASSKKKKCFCCEEYTLVVGTEYEVCPMCGWIDDKYQNRHPDSTEGRNPTSLNIAREEYHAKRQADKTT